jgi:uncharacterized membrane protein (UPF0127 family)
MYIDIYLNVIFIDLDATLKKVEGGRKENQDAVKKFETEKKVFECPSNIYFKI